MGALPVCKWGEAGIAIVQRAGVINRRMTPCIPGLEVDRPPCQPLLLSSQSRHELQHHACLTACEAHPLCLLPPPAAVPFLELAAYAGYAFVPACASLLVQLIIPGGQPWQGGQGPGLADCSRAGTRLDAMEEALSGQVWGYHSSPLEYLPPGQLHLSPCACWHGCVQAAVRRITWCGPMALSVLRFSWWVGHVKVWEKQGMREFKAGHCW